MTPDASGLLAPGSYVAVGVGPVQDAVDTASAPQSRTVAAGAAPASDSAWAAFDEARPLLAAVPLLCGMLLCGVLVRDGTLDDTATSVPVLLGLLWLAAAGMVLGLPWRRAASLSPIRPDRRTSLAAASIAWAALVLVPGLLRPAPLPMSDLALAGRFPDADSFATAVYGLAAVCAACAAGGAPRWALASLLLPWLPAAATWLRGGASGTDAAACAGIATALAAIVARSRWCQLQTARQSACDWRARVRALTASRDEAVKADQEKSRFLAMASHDLRQPVHAIGLFAATLEKRLGGRQEEPLVRNLVRAIDGLDRSFNAILDISRLDAGAVEPRVQHFPLRDLFRRLHMHFAGQAEQKGLGLRFSPGGKSISSDPQLLERVLGNLVQNAIKYTEQGGIVVVARSRAAHLHIEIWDTGIGIQPADLPKVFDEFYQVGRSAHVRAQGLGMGLAIVKRLVRLLGHELTVASRPGRGTVFRLRIALGGLPEIQDVTAPADTLPMPLLQPRTVLVIDDEEPIRDGLCMLLQEWGYDALAAGSIDDAERAVGTLELPPDLIICDLHLGPGRDGIAGIDALRTQCGCHIPAMLVTGDTSPAEIRRVTESGHPVLFKPVQPRKLYNALRGLAS